MAYYQDEDGDGLYDGWESANGLEQGVNLTGRGAARYQCSTTYPCDRLRAP